MPSTPLLTPNRSPSKTDQSVYGAAVSNTPVTSTPTVHSHAVPLSAAAVAPPPAPSVSHPSAQSPARTVNPWLSLFVILLAPTISVLDVFITNISLPTIRQFYGTTDASVQLVIASYLIGYAVFLITGSRMGDYAGRKKIFIGGLLAFTIASAWCGFAPTIHQLITARFFQGTAAALAVPQAVTLIQLNFPAPKDRDKAFGYFGISLGLAAVLGQFLGGYFISSHLIRDSWRLIFLVNLPIGVLACILAYYFVPESRQNRTARFDFPGVILLTLSLSALIYPIIEGRESGWPAWTIAMLIASLGLLAAFLWYEHRRVTKGQEPLINMQLFRNKSFNTGVLSVLFWYGMHTAYYLVSAVYLQNGYHMSPLSESYCFIALGSTYILSSYWSIRNVARYGIAMLQAGCVLMVVSFSLQLLLLHTEVLSIPYLLVCFLFYGLGAGLVLPSLLNVSLRHVPAEFAGAASGVYYTIQQCASALGVSILGGIFYYYIQHTHSYFTAFKIVAGVMIVYLLITIALLNRLRKN